MISYARSRTTYYDTMRNGLLPIKVLAKMAHFEDGEVKPLDLYACRVQRTRGAYKAGDMMYLPNRHVVRKSGVRDGFVRVCTADLSEVE